MGKVRLSSKSSVLNYPTIKPTLDLNFAKAKVLDPRITFTSASSGTTNTLTNNVSFNRIAQNINGSITRFPGNIAQVSIYNRALTAAEVQQNFNALRGRFEI